MSLLLVGLIACRLPAPQPATPSPEAPQDAPHTDTRTIGWSVQGRPIRLQIAGRGPRTVLWIGGVHGDETEGAAATAALPQAVIDRPGLPEQITLHVVQDLNPDGRAAGSRGNANGVDLNRNFPAPSFEPRQRHGQAPLDQPESAVLADLVRDIQPDLVIAAHSWRGDHFINFDGPEEAAALAQVFSQESGYRVVPSDAFNPTPGSLGGWIGSTLQTPILTLEYARGADPEACWEETRQAIIAVLTPTATDASAPG